MKLFGSMSPYLVATLLLLFFIPALPVAAQRGSTLTMTPTPDHRELDVVGGQPADPGEWPWQAMVLPGPYLCGGSLIATDWVLTAAHCVFEEEGVLFAPSSIKVRLGEYDRTRAESGEQVMAVAQIIAHELYDSATNDHDIALLRLASPALFTAKVKPINLLNQSTESTLAAPGQAATVTGWGTTKEGGTAATLLMEVAVPIVSNVQCDRSYGYITDNMICAGYAAGGKDSCQGDSGGPLVVADENGGWQLSGIVSFGYGCARANYYGVYTRVSQYVEWIAAQTGSADGTPTPTKTPLGTPTTPIATPTPTGPAATPTVSATAVVTVTTPASTPLPSATPTVAPTNSATHETVEVMPDEESYFSYEDLSGSYVGVTVPAGAVDEPVTMIVDVPSTTVVQGANVAFAKRVLQLSIYRETVALSGYRFQEPIGVELIYAESDIKGADAQNLALAIYDFATDSWTTEGITVIEHNREFNYLLVETTRTGIYALTTANRTLFLPIVQR